MKKRGMRKVQHSKKNSFDTKQLVIGVAAFLIFLFLIGVVNVSSPEQAVSASGATITAHNTKDAFIQFIGNWQEGSMEKSVLKYFFAFIVLLLVMSALKFAMFPPSGFLRFLLSLVVSFISVAYITPTEFYTILAGYSALALTLSVILPFIIILFFAAMLIDVEHIRTMSVGKILAEIMIWVAYITLLMYKLISGLMSGDLNFDKTLGTIIVILVLAGISVGIVLFNKQFIKFLVQIRNTITEVSESMISTTEAARERGRRTIHHEIEGSRGG